jgi:hypothetical protein
MQAYLPNKNKDYNMENYIAKPYKNYILPTLFGKFQRKVCIA